jgi:hypothetical protein
MPEPTVGSLKKLYRYSLSEDVYDLIVAPLTDALYGDNPGYKEVENILDTLTELHKCLWNTKTSLSFPGAVAGRFEELMLPLRKCMKDGWENIKVGAEQQKITKEQRKLGEKDWSLGGDVTVYKTGGPTVTYQLKVANAGKEENLVEHINKAGAQLSGETGERPELGSTRVIYLLVQNTQAFDAYTAGGWKVMVETALGKDYVSDRGVQNLIDPSKSKPPRIVTADSIRNSVDIVKIFTSNKRFRINVIGGVVQIPAEKGASTSRYIAYTNGTLEAHWNWLLNWFKERAAEKKDDWEPMVRVTKENGVNGKAGSWTTLPRQSQTGIVL